MFELLGVEQTAAIQVLLTLVGGLTVVYVCFRIVSWLFGQIAILITWAMRGLVAAALTRVLWEWISMKFNLSETVRTLLL